MQNNNDITSITITNNISVTVPSSSQLMTTFILQEQHDWFEDEMSFIRHYIKPGMKVVDIGANYGLYTLTISNIVGDAGKVWAFEPTMSTSNFLKQSILTNGFDNIELIRAGLSEKSGEAKFYTCPNSELNSLSKVQAAGDQFETITLSTLDTCQNKYGWEHLDFIKLDAEGEEVNILKSGHKTLSSLSPLIMFELKHGENINLHLINSFNNLNYDCYRLIPGLNILIPFDHNEPFDNYLLNLFCCKKDKLKQLEDEGFIVKKWHSINLDNSALTSDYMKKFAFVESLTSLNQPSDTNDDSADYFYILSTYIKSLSESANSQDKISYLMASLDRLRSMLMNGEQRIERLCTFARIAFDAGERNLGVQILYGLINSYADNLNFEIREPLLPASQRYDNIPPRGKMNEWLFSSILEQFIIKHAFSTYFSRQVSLPFFEQLNSLGFINEEMKNRHQLLKSCFSQ